MPAGRPKVFDEKIAAQLLEQIATSSKSLRTICKDDKYPCVATVLTWLKENHEFLAQYNIAKQEQADYMIEEMLDIADDGSNDYMTIVKGDKEYNVEDREVTNRSKLRVETRKWIASKLKPKKYGDKIDIDHTTDGQPIQINILPASQKNGA